MNLSEIIQSVKTKYYNFGLKDKNIEKLANIVKTNMDAMGAIEDEQAVLTAQVGALEPYLSVFQSEFDARRAQPQPQQPQPVVPPVQTPQPQPQQPQAQTPEGWDEVLKFVQGQQKREQQKASFETRTKLMDTIKGKISPNGQLNEGTLYKLFSQHADQFTEGADVEALTKNFQEMYNKEAKDIIPQQPFIPTSSVPGATVADTDKQTATKGMIDKFITTRRI